MPLVSSQLFLLAILFATSHGQINSADYQINCSTLREGQYLCPLPDIDLATQQPRGCTRDNRANSKHYNLKFIFIFLNKNREAI